MSQLDELIDRCNRMSYLLGLCTGCLLELIGDSSIPNFQKEKLQDLLSRLYPSIDELFYKEPCTHEWIAFSPEITVQSGEITAVAAQTKIKCSKCNKDYK